MRILILSCNTGEGHNSAAKAIQEVLTARGVFSEMTDGLAFLTGCALVRPIPDGGGAQPRPGRRLHAV